MLRGRQYYTVDGVQIAVYFFEIMNITQGMNSGISHRGRMALDDGGKDTGIDSAFAPFDMKIVWKKPNGSKTGIVFTNTRPVLAANGKIYAAELINVLMWHDNDTSDLWVGKTFLQGERFYEEGTADNATGNHIHYMVSFTKYDGSYPLYLTWAMNWALKNQASPVDLFFINDTVIKRSWGYAWKKYNLKVLNNIEEPSQGKKYLYLDKTVVSWRVYPLDKVARVGNEIGRLAPKKFGGLTYEILADLGNDVYKISTQTYGIVKIYAGPDTKSEIKEV